MQLDIRMFQILRTVQGSEKMRMNCLLLSIVSAVILYSGCAYMNGDAIWLSEGQKEVTLRNRFSTFGDVEYSFDESNLPFCFNLFGCHEFGHLGHFIGAPDFSKGGYIAKGDVLRFSVERVKTNEHVEFLVSNGVMRVVDSNVLYCRIERRNSSGLNSMRIVDINERWHEYTMEKLLSIIVWKDGFSIAIQQLGEYGVVYNYFFQSNHNDSMRLRIFEIKNLRWFHWAQL